MTMRRTVFLYGNADSCLQARLILENLPEVKQIRTAASSAEIKLLLTQPIHEKNLIPLLSQSGISGFRLE